MMTESVQEPGKMVRINWYFPESVNSNYATHIVVQHTEHDFTISFFEVYSPPTIGTPEEIRKIVETTESIPAKCVARIIVAADRLPGFLEVLQDNLRGFREKYRADE